jgi:hypothetical protein
MARTTTYIFAGDEVKSRSLVGLANIQLEKLRNQMKFANLQQYSLSLIDKSGFVIVVSSVFGFEVANVFCPSSIKQKVIDKIKSISLMSWNKLPPTKEGTSNIDVSLLTVDPLVTGGYYCTISINPGKDEDGKILPAKFSIKLVDDAVGWTIEQGIRQLDDSYHVDGMSATLLLSAGVSGECKITVIDSITELRKIIAVSNPLTLFFYDSGYYRPLYDLTKSYSLGEIDIEESIVAPYTATSDYSVVETDLGGGVFQYDYTNHAYINGILVATTYYTNIVTSTTNSQETTSSGDYCGIITSTIGASFSGSNDLFIQYVPTIVTQSGSSIGISDFWGNTIAGIITDESEMTSNIPSYGVFTKTNELVYVSYFDNNNYAKCYKDSTEVGATYSYKGKSNGVDFDIRLANRFNTFDEVIYGKVT